MTTPTPKRKPPAKKIVAGTSRRKPSDTRKKKKNAGPAKTTAPKPLQKTGSLQDKTRGNDRGAVPPPHALISRSTSISAQRARVLAALRAGPKTSHDLRCLGIYQAPARVKELRDDFGYVIETTRVTLVDRDGYSHPRAGLYELIADPPQFGLDFGRDAANNPTVPKRKGPKQ